MQPSNSHGLVKLNREVIKELEARLYRVEEEQRVTKSQD
jgi:hypothetical protein